jgi:putative sterol carrier protein
MATTRVQHVVSGGPAGEVAYVVEVADGAVVSTSLGADDTADLTFAERHDDAAKVAAGELGLDDAFMRGRAKLTGSMGTFMALLPVFRSDAYRAAQADALGGAGS